MIEESTTIFEMLEKHPDIEYIMLIWVWEDDLCKKLIRVKNRLPAQPLYRISWMEPELSYVGPYIENDDKVAFQKWVNDHGLDDKYEYLYVSNELIYGNADDYVMVKCLRGDQFEESLNVGEEHPSKFRYVDVAEFSHIGPDGIYDEKTHEILSRRCADVQPCDRCHHPEGHR